MPFPWISNSVVGLQLSNLAQQGEGVRSDAVFAITKNLAPEVSYCSLKMQSSTVTLGNIKLFNVCLQA